jgi:hypothetical protein
MTNPMLKKALTTMMEEDRAEKICLIEDIMKAGRLLASVENKLQSDIIQNPQEVFDRLYDQTINELQITEALISMRLTKLMQRQVDGLKEIMKGGKNDC